MRRYRPVPLVKLLRELMGYASVALDLSFYAVAFTDQGASYEVKQLEEIAELLWEDAVVQASLAARSVEEAVRMVSVYRVLDALLRVIDVAADFASLVIRGVETPEMLKRALLTGAEVTAPLRVQGRVRVGDIEEMGVDVVAVRRGSEWILYPGDELTLEEGDVALVRGSPENVSKVTGLSVSGVGEGGEVERETLRLKKLADVLFELGFYSILYGDSMVAHQVIEIEHRLDDDIIDYYESVSRLGLSPQQEYTLHRFAETVENVSDAAATMASMVQRHEPIHTVIAAAEDQAPEKIIALRYEGPRRRLAETPLYREELLVLAVEAGGRWLPTPPQDTILEPGSRLILKVYAEDVDELLEELEGAGFKPIEARLAGEEG